MPRDATSLNKSPLSGHAHMLVRDEMLEQVRPLLCSLGSKRAAPAVGNQRQLPQVQHRVADMRRSASQDGDRDCVR